MTSLYLLHQQTCICDYCHAVMTTSQLYEPHIRGTGTHLLPVRNAAPSTPIELVVLPATSTPRCHTCYSPLDAARGREAAAAWELARRRKAAEATGVARTGTLIAKRSGPSAHSRPTRSIADIQNDLA